MFRCKRPRSTPPAWPHRAKSSRPICQPRSCWRRLRPAREGRSSHRGRKACLLGLRSRHGTKALSRLAPGELMRSLHNAQRNVPRRPIRRGADSVVWLDLQRNIYYVPGQRRYGRGATAHSHVARKRARAPTAAPSGPAVMMGDSAPSQGASSAKWIGGLPSCHEGWAWSELRWVEFSGFLPRHFQGFL